MPTGVEAVPTRADLAERLRETGRQLGLVRVGFARAEKFARTRQEIEERRSAGYFGKMRFTMARPEISCDPAATLPGVRTLVVGALDYYRPAPPRPSGRPMGRIARYSWTDWYRILREKLDQMADVLRSAGWQAMVLSDANSLVDRESAARALVGHYGKNANLITGQAGSWVVLGTVLTDADIPPDENATDDCGWCRTCLPRCPTGAIVAPGVIDARRCIAYLLQAEGDIPAEYRATVGDRIYGCDDCQECCPSNDVTRSSVDGHDDGEDPPLEAWVDLIEMVGMSDRELLERFSRFYIPRRKPAYLRRNAIVALGNSGDRSAVPYLLRWAESDDAMLRTHAEWAISRLQGDRDRRNEVVNN